LYEPSKMSSDKGFRSGVGSL